MSKHIVTVKQLGSGGGAYLNVEDVHGGILVKTHTLGQPTYLIQYGRYGIGLITFDNQGKANEWLDKHGSQWDDVTQVGM